MVGFQLHGKKGIYIDICCARKLTMIGREKRASIMRVVLCAQLSITSNEPKTVFRAFTDLKIVRGVVVGGFKGDSNV